MKCDVVLTVVSSAVVTVECGPNTEDACSKAWDKYEAGEIPEEDWYVVETNACVDNIIREGKEE